MNLAEEEQKICTQFLNPAVITQKKKKKETIDMVSVYKYTYWAQHKPKCVQLILKMLIFSEEAFEYSSKWK